MLLYEIYWIRYFRSEKNHAGFLWQPAGYSHPGRHTPPHRRLFAFGGLWKKNIVLAVSVLILGVGHIGIHLMHLKAIPPRQDEA